ncbi:MAG: hypothetical protein Q4E09_02605 [Eubacteriales bacterium]|nr:hypothetical protein [Eubacteriales bacterium]
MAKTSTRKQSTPKTKSGEAKTASKTGRSAKRQSSSKAKTSAKKSDKEKNTGFGLLTLQSGWARFLLFVLVLLALLLINLLISQDRLATFTLLTGSEILTAILASWVIFLHKQKQNEALEDENSDI